jgi:ribose transport system substrate-binding protein
MAANDQSTVEPAPHKQSSAAHWRNFAIILMIPIIIALIVAWKGNLFKPTPKVALITSTEEAYWDRVIAGAQRGGELFEMNLTVIRSKPDEKFQSDQIRKLLSDGYDGIAVSPVNPVAQRDLLREVASKSVLVTFDSDCEDSNRKAFIGTDNYVAGRLCAEQVRDAIPDGGEVLISVGSVDKENGRLRRQGLIDSLVGRTVDPKREMDPLATPVKGDKYVVVETLVDGVDRAKATTLISEAVKKHPNVKCIIGLFGYSAPSILKALEENSLLGKIQVVGFDENDSTLKGIESGQVYATLVQDQFGMGYDTIRFFNESMRGLPPSLGPGNHMHYLGCRPITASEVDIVRYEMQREPSTQPK